MELTDFKSTDRLANSSYFANNLVAGHLGEFGTSPSVVDLMNIYIYMSFNSLKNNHFATYHWRKCRSVLCEVRRRDHQADEGHTQMEPNLPSKIQKYNISV